MGGMSIVGSDVTTTLTQAEDPGLDARSLSRLSLTCAQGATLLGLIVLVGWITGNDLLKRGLPGAIVMLPWTAAGLTLGGGSLWIQAAMDRSGIRSLTAALASRTMAFGVLAMGIVMAIQRFGGFEWSINRIFFSQELWAFPYRPLGLMATNSSVCFSLLGLALVLLSIRKWNGLRETACSAALLIAFLAVLGHVYGVSSLYSLDQYAGMAPITVIGFLLLSIGLLVARSDGGAAALLVGSGGSALITRRLLLACLVLPVIFGRLWLEARRSDIVSRELGVSLFVVMTVVVFITVLFWTARAMRKSEQKREEALAERSCRARLRSTRVRRRKKRTGRSPIFSR